jgi:hypothetical protein
VEELKWKTLNLNLRVVDNLAHFLQKMQNGPGLPGRFVKVLVTLQQLPAA